MCFFLVQIGFTLGTNTFEPWHMIRGVFQWSRPKSRVPQDPIGNGPKVLVLTTTDKLIKA